MEGVVYYKLIEHFSMQFNLYFCKSICVLAHLDIEQLVKLELLAKMFNNIYLFNHELQTAIEGISSPQWVPQLFARTVTENQKRWAPE